VSTALLAIAPPTSEPLDCVLWDVVEEHLAEAAFGLELFDLALEHPSRTLSELDRYPEGRLRAHLDALVVGGEAVRERLLRPAIEDPDDDEPAPVTAAAIALIDQSCLNDVIPALSHKSTAIRRALVRATSLAGNDDFDRWVELRLLSPSSMHEAETLLNVHAVRGISVPSIHKWLRSGDADVVAAAATAARWSEPATAKAAVEDLLEHADHRVRDAALISALHLGSRGAWLVCQRRALEDVAPSPLTLAVAAALGGRDLISQLARRIDRKEDRASILFALAFSGDPRQIPMLLDQLRSGDASHAKLALQAIAAIIGLDLRDDAFAAAVEPAPDDDSVDDAAALPALEDDDLDACLVPRPEDALPLPNAVAVEQFWKQNAKRFDPSRRYLAGMEFSPELLLRQLEGGPLRLRHVHALSLSIRAGRSATVDTRAWSTTQRARMAVVRAAGLASSVRFTSAV
jgi:uncharacterized protein (TIGR02270 family)